MFYKYSGNASPTWTICTDSVKLRWYVKDTIILTIRTLPKDLVDWNTH